MTYPPQPGGYDPYGQQQPGYGQQPGYSPQQPVTGVPSSPAGGYGQPAYAQPSFGGPGHGAPVPEPGERPGMVTTAAMLMVAMTVIMLLIGALVIVFGLEEASKAEATCDGEYYNSCDDVTAGKVALTIAGIFYLIVGLGVIGLALGVLRGQNWARITTWVIYGLFGLCGICGFLISVGAMSDMGGMAMGGAVWTLSMLVQVVVEGVTVLLLALPVSNQWFRAVGQAKRAGVI